MSAIITNKGPAVTNLAIEGMSCSSCASHVTEALESVPGVSSVEISIRTGTAIVRHDRTTTLDSMIQAVQAVGYGASED